MTPPWSTYALVLASAGLFVGCEAARPEPPRVAGQVVQPSALTVDFGKRFDLHTNLGSGGSVFRNCRILGSVGGDDRTKVAALSPSSTFSPFEQRWLVLEDDYKRRIYIPAQSVIYFEDSDAPTTKPTE